MLALFRRLFAGRPPVPTATAPRSRVRDLTSIHTTDPALLRQLRDLRWTLDYYVNDNGLVYLLEYREGSQRMATGRKLRTLGIHTVETKLMEQGFALLDDLPGRSLVNGMLVRRAHEILQNGETEMRVARERLLREADGRARDERGIAHLRDAVESDYRSDHRILFRHRVSIRRPDVSFTPPATKVIGS